jgi:hypothetical protein
MRNNLKIELSTLISGDTVTQSRHFVKNFSKILKKTCFCVLSQPFSKNLITIAHILYLKINILYWLSRIIGNAFYFSIFKMHFKMHFKMRVKMYF